MRRRGDRLRAFAARRFDAVTMARVIDPAIADLQAEPVSVAGYLAVLKVIALCVPEASMSGRGRAWAFSVVVMAAVVAALELPAMIIAWNQRAIDPRMVLYLVPQGLSVAAAVGMLLGVVFGFGGRTLSTRMVHWIVAVAIVVAGASFVNAGWITPPANQAFRAALSQRAGWPGPPSRGYPEMTFGELRRQLDLAALNPSTVVATDLHYMAVSYQGRWAVSSAPLMFTLFALLIVGRSRLARWTAALAVCAAYLGYCLYLTVPRLVALDGPWPGAAAWYPDVALAIVIAKMLSRSLWPRGSAPGVSA